ncbi:MAG: hypothetical protein EA402_06295 [Planctomycetota bacterium]|nr:MAG: hypothetical protein EA402_06295 [Planctomycetota bacterium]
MALPPFLINHGEKVAVGLVVLFGVYLVWSTASDDRITPPRPATQVEMDFSIVERAVANPGEPNLRPPPDVAGHIRQRLALAAELPQQSVMAFIHEIFSLGQTTFQRHPPFLYGFELRAPSLRVDDRVGSLSLRLALPEERRGERGRIRDAHSRPFREERMVERDRYVNTAEVLGLQVQRRQGDGPWQPLPQAGNEAGLIPLDRVASERRLEDVSEWQTYEFRARLIAAATGPETEGSPTLGNEVLVFAGSSPLEATAGVWEALDNLVWQGVPLNVPTAERASDVLRRQLQAAVGRPLEPRTQMYLGPWSEIASEQVSSTTRFALIRVSPPVQQGAPPRVQFGLTRKIGDSWIPLVRQTVELGEMVGNAQELIQGERDGRNVQIPVDLSTPFRLVDVSLDAERVTHYEVRNVSDGGSRTIDIVERFDRAARTVTLENTATGRRMTLVQLARAIVVRPNSDILLNFPDRQPGTINELDLFVADPMAFRQPRLRLPEPKWHEADDPVLRQLFPQEVELMNIQSRYLELPDGRFVVIDEFNPRLLRVLIRPDGAYANRRLVRDSEEDDEE